MKQRVNAITLDVVDLERGRRFYEALDWKTGADPGAGAIEETGPRECDRS